MQKKFIQGYKQDPQFWTIYEEASKLEDSKSLGKKFLKNENDLLFFLNAVKSFTACTGETKRGLAWTHTKPTLNPTNTHTQISISAEGSKEFNSTCTLTVSQRISRALSQWPDATRSNQQYLKFSLFLLWSFLQESTEYHATLKAKTFIIFYKQTHRSAKTTQSAQWAH